MLEEAIPSEDRAPTGARRGGVGGAGVLETLDPAAESILGVGGRRLGAEER